MYNSYSNPRLTNCRFSANIAQRSGGGTYNSGAGPILTNCILSVNSAENGGGVHNSNSNSRITNCTFTGNSAVSSTGDGGAVYNWLGKPVVTNCTFSANAANDHGGGIYCGDFSNTEIRNCIFCDNSAAVGPEIALNDDPCFPPSVTVSCCDVGGGQGGVGGWGLLNWEPGNIEADPLFVDPNGPDGIVGTGDENLRLSENSPCIDAGNNSVVETNSTDLDGNPRILDGDKDGDSVVDMGAYEFSITCCGADLNGDGLVNYVDFAVLAGQWLEEVGVLSADIAPDCGDGKVAIEDILILAANWLAITGETNLAGYWPMDDDANNTTVADSVGGNNGTAQQNTSDISITGMIDGALSFNGIDDYIQIADSEPLSPTDEVTVCGWFWFNDASENVGLIWKHNYNYALWTTSDTVRFAAWNSSSEGSTATFSTSLLEAGWNFIAGVFDGTTVICISGIGRVHSILTAKSTMSGFSTGPYPARRLKHCIINNPYSKRTAYPNFSKQPGLYLTNMVCRRRF